MRIPRGSTIRRKVVSLGVLTLAILTPALSQPSGPRTADWRVVKSIPVAGDGGFDYIVFEPTMRRLYVSHGTKVDVLEAATGKAVGSIADTPGVHGIAIVPELQRGFTTNGGNGTVSVFDTTSLQTTATITVDPHPDFVFYDRALKRVFVCHGDAAEITVIDPKTSQVTSKIALVGGAEAAVIDRTNGYVNLEQEASVVHFDASKMKVLHTWPITGCKTPTGLAMDTASGRLFIGCRSKVLAVMEAATGNVVTTLPIGAGVDAVVFDPATHLIFASNGEGTVSVIEQRGANEYVKLPDITTEAGAKTMAYDPKSQHLYLSTAERAPVPEGSAQRPVPKPGTFHVLVVGAR